MYTVQDKTNEMKSVENIHLLLTLFSVINIIVQPVWSRRESRYRDDGNHESVKAPHHRKDHNHKENGHKKQYTDDEVQKSTGHPHTLEVLDHQSLGYWPICSWCHSVHFDPDRLPKVLPIASCCGTDRNITRVRGLHNVHCETIYYNLLVKLRIANQTEEEDDSNSWEDKWLKVPAGCTPAYPATQNQKKRRKDSTDGKAKSKKPKTNVNSA